MAFIKPWQFDYASEPKKRQHIAAEITEDIPRKSRDSYRSDW